MRKDFRFGGSGGQGVISLAVLLANAYGVQNNYEVAQTQSYGLLPAAAPVRRSSSFPTSASTTSRPISSTHSLRSTSPALINSRATSTPIPACLWTARLSRRRTSGTPAKQVFLFPATKYAEENFRVVCTNIVMMGYIVAHNPDISLENAQNAIRAVMNPKVVDLNLKALQFGYEHGKADLA